MGFDKEKVKQIQRLILLTALLVLGIIYSRQVFYGIGFFLGILKPFIIGGAIAFVLNVPLRSIENKLFKKWNGKAAQKFKRPLSILLSIIFIIALIVIVIVTVTPQLFKTMDELGKEIPPFFNSLFVQLEALSQRYPQIQVYLYEWQDIKLDWNTVLNSIVNFMKTGMTDMLSSTFNVASSIAGAFMNGFIGFIFALYILGQKEKLAQQGKRMLSAYCKPKLNTKICKVLSLLYDNFSNFITGQCLEAFILGSMFVITMLIFRLPYAVLVGVLIAFTALIPIVGAFIGCFVGAFLMMVDNPQKAITFVILFLVLQQLEGNLVYPRVVGNKVGLPSIWVLMAVTIGGSLFGIVGMLAFIPLVSTIYALLRENVNQRNQRFSGHKRKEKQGVQKSPEQNEERQNRK